MTSLPSPASTSCEYSTIVHSNKVFRSAIKRTSFQTCSEKGFLSLQNRIRSLHRESYSSTIILSPTSQRAELIVPRRSFRASFRDSYCSSDLISDRRSDRSCHPAKRNCGQVPPTLEKVIPQLLTLFPSSILFKTVFTFNWLLENQQAGFFFFCVVGFESSFSRHCHSFLPIARISRNQTFIHGSS